MSIARLTGRYLQSAGAAFFWAKENGQSQLLPPNTEGLFTITTDLLLCQPQSPGQGPGLSPASPQAASGEDQLGETFPLFQVKFKPRPEDGDGLRLLAKVLRR